MTPSSTKEVCTTGFRMKSVTSCPVSFGDFCFHFVCPDCEHWDRENRECTADDCCCTDKAYETLKKYELYMTKESGFLGWELRPRKDAEANEQT